MKNDIMHSGKLYNYQRQHIYNVHKQRINSIARNNSSILKNNQFTSNKTIQYLSKSFKTEEQLRLQKQNLRLMKKISEIGRRKKYQVIPADQTQIQEYQKMGSLHRKLKQNQRFRKDKQIQQQNQKIVAKLLQKISRTSEFKNNEQNQHSLRKSRSKQQRNNSLRKSRSKQSSISKSPDLYNKLSSQVQIIRQRSAIIRQRNSKMDTISLQLPLLKPRQGVHKANKNSKSHFQQNSKKILQRPTLDIDKLLSSLSSRNETNDTAGQKIIEKLRFQQKNQVVKQRIKQRNKANPQQNIQRNGKQIQIVNQDSYEEDYEYQMDVDDFQNEQNEKMLVKSQNAKNIKQQVASNQKQKIETYKSISNQIQDDKKRKQIKQKQEKDKLINEYQNQQFQT